MVRARRSRSSICATAVTGSSTSHRWWATTRRAPSRARADGGRTCRRRSCEGIERRRPLAFEGLDAGFAAHELEYPSGTIPPGGQLMATDLTKLSVEQKLKLV